MANIILTAAGTAIGTYFGGPLGGAIGGAIGNTLGTYVDNQYLSKGVTRTGPRIADLTMQVSSYGKPIPKVYGNMRMAGNVIWAQPIQETANNVSSGGGKGGGSAQVSSTNYSYSATLAIALCEGEIDGIVQVWADSQLLSNDFLTGGANNYNIYLGTETQTPDPVMESFDGVGNVPAYRGFAYVVIQDFPLANFGNRIPNFTFEVKRTIRNSPALEDKITAVTLIPGAGETVYDTVIQKTVNILTGVASSPSNMHNTLSKADVLSALDQLQGTLPNLQWVGLVVTWFATSIDAGTCTIVPKVEAHGTITTSPDAWSVAGLTRSDVEVVQHFLSGTPTYGGTPSDSSIIHLVQELKNRGYNVMFYPMVFVDTITPESKPWRGRITPANATDAANWFTKTNGYNHFINHYLNLSIGGVNLKDHIDAFVIGSEYVGMTSATFATGVYPAVTGFINVATTAKSILPSNVKTVYAADWSEYHHTTGGWFNMDPLWSSSSLDIVGIDAYMPLTPDLPQTQIAYQDVYNGWTSGEGWDYYWDSTRTTRTNFASPVFAWKNIEYWWKNTHTNPDTSTTSWTAKMKPIWFTEFGFPSVDGCSNQPNVFVDPSSVESFYPRGSRQRIDNAAQRQALEATIDYWNAENAATGNSNLIAQKFVWTWDARPYPEYPNLSTVWADGNLWKTGHWINGKLGVSSLGAVINELLSAISVNNYDTSSLSDNLDGFIINNIQTVREAVQTLTTPYFFDMVESSGSLKFIKRGNASVMTIPQDNMVPGSTHNGPLRSTAKMTRTQELDLPHSYSVSYYNRQQSYETNTQIAQRQASNAVKKQNLSWPLSLADQKARNIAETLLYSDWTARTSYDFILPPQYAMLEPTDVITITVDNIDRVVRITDMNINPDGSSKIMAVAEDTGIYDVYLPPVTSVTAQSVPLAIPQTQLDLLDLPAFPHDAQTDAYMGVAAAALDPGWKGALLYRSDDGGVSGGNTYNLLTSLPFQSTIGTASTVLADGSVNTFDNAHSVTVILTYGQLSSTTTLAVLNGANSAMLGGEVIQFTTATLIAGSTYQLSGLLRGRLGTEDQTATHVSGELFVLLDSSLTRLTISASMIGLPRYYKGVSSGNTLGNTSEESFTYTARQLRPYAPVQITGLRDGSGNLTINWVRRTRIGGDLRDGVDVPLSEASESYQVDIMNGSTVVRTIATTSPSASYSAANQTTDFGSPQSSVTVHVYQISAIVGRGIAGIGAV